MSTKLEKYLREQRLRIDVEYPDDDAIWEGINRRLPENRVTDNSTRLIREPRNTFWKVAAIITILISTGYISYDLIQDQKINRHGVLSAVSEDLGEQEYQYINTVSLKREEIRSIDIPKNDIINTLFEELKLQDELYKEASLDIEEIVDSDRVVNTIFNIYERKIDLLERIIIETNKTRNYEKNSEVSL